MNPYFELDKNVTSLEQATLLALGIAPIPPGMYRLVEKTVAYLPDRLRTLKLSGHLDIAEVVIIEQALLLLQVELSHIHQNPDNQTGHSSKPTLD